MKKNLTELVFILDRSGSMSRTRKRYHRRLQLPARKAEKGTRRGDHHHRVI